MSIGSSLSVIAALGFVLVLLGIALKALRAFAPGATSRGRLTMRVVQRLSLGPKQGIAVVQIGRRHIDIFERGNDKPRTTEARVVSFSSLASADWKLSLPKQPVSATTLVSYQ